jgi:tRNA threonylcarbamoyladenosine biosynthesis protein TsaB
MNEVYWAEVVARADGGVDLRQERLGPPASVTIAPADGAGVVAAGHGWRAYPALVERYPAVAARFPDLLPRAHEIARLGALEVAAGRTVAAEDATPVYLRDDVATRSGRTPPGVTNA